MCQMGIYTTNRILPHPKQRFNRHALKSNKATCLCLYSRIRCNGLRLEQSVSGGADVMEVRDVELKHSPHR